MQFLLGLAVGVLYWDNKTAINNVAKQLFNHVFGDPKLSNITKKDDSNEG